MMAILSFIMENLGGWAIGAVSILIGAVGLYFKGRGDQKRREQEKRAQARIEAMKERKEVDYEVDNLNDDDLDDRLAKWMRDGDG
ncbi:hypothetical protein MXMO3_01836 [Maritalea myrionectae]|uniref:Uncharacterized protein n=2 Tax=Maritalea myrionectae TaxID=454601 RepID=A0A2R4ME92_9HYPH|nr:hypothetical protein MXMO3_01836 [Maritalea myrionectae]